MKHAIVFAHPKRASLTVAAAHAYADTVRGLGHAEVLRDLYWLGFDPCLKAGEIPGPKGAVAGKDVRDERALIADADVFAFVYPLWFNAPPAMLKGYVDRVFSSGFGFTNVAGGGSEPLLEGKKLISITFSGAPEQWFRETGALAALTTLFDQHLARMTGLSVLDHVHFGGITPDITEEAVGDVLAAVRKAAADHFGAQAANNVLV